MTVLLREAGTFSDVRPPHHERAGHQRRHEISVSRGASSRRPTTVRNRWASSPAEIESVRYGSVEPLRTLSIQPIRREPGRIGHRLGWSENPLSAFAPDVAAPHRPAVPPLSLPVRQVGRWSSPARCLQPFPGRGRLRIHGPWVGARIVVVEFSEVIRRRRMVRHYTDQPLPSEVVERILSNALRAPSAGFSQGWAFLALTEEEDRARFWARATTDSEEPSTMLNAPLVVVPMAHKMAYLERYAESDKGWEDRAESRWPAPYWDIDTGMATLLMLLTAVDEGLGACFFGIEPEQLQPVRTEFGVPDDYAPIGALTVGYRAPEQPVEGSAGTRRRRGVADVVHRGQWGRHD